MELRSISIILRPKKKRRSPLLIPVILLMIFVTSGIVIPFTERFVKKGVSITGLNVI